jgi:hypothetical protein
MISPMVSTIVLASKGVYYTIADEMIGSWAEEPDEHLTIGQETPHGFDLATAAVPDRT